MLAPFVGGIELFTLTTTLSCKRKGICHPHLTPFERLTALSRFDKLTTLSQPKGLSKGSPLKGEGD